MKRFPRCIMATCVVPWDEQGNFIEDLFRHQVRKLASDFTPHLYVFGTAGEGYAVSEPLFDRIVKVFHDTMKSSGAEAMVGVINLSLPTILDRINRARDIGVRLFQISLPSWGVLSDAEMFEFFRQVCGRFPDCNFLHYNLMRTKRLVTPQEYARLAEEHPNLVATKNSTDSMIRIEGLLRHAPQLQHFLDETGFAYGNLIGECGLLASMVCTNYRSAHGYFEATCKRDVEQLLNLQCELLALSHDFLASVGDRPHIDGAYDKMLWKLHDRRFPLRMLPPYQGVDEETFDRFAKLLAHKYPQWAPD